MTPMFFTDFIIFQDDDHHRNLLNDVFRQFLTFIQFTRQNFLSPSNLVLKVDGMEIRFFDKIMTLYFLSFYVKIFSKRHK